MEKFCSLLIACVLVVNASAMFPLNKRLYRSLPSVSDDHYQELNSDGTYKYAYTGENRYTAERKLSDGTVEGETLYVRPDGIPVKVHYFADARGYRPKTEVLYSERLVPSNRRAKVIVPDLIYKEVEVDAPETRTPTLVLAPPPRDVPVPVAVPYNVPKSTDDSSINVKLEGSHITLGNSNGGETAIANPSVTAIVGPGGRAELRPEGIAQTRSGGVAISNPSTNAVVGPGGSVVLAPSARASTVSDYSDLAPVPAVSSVRSSQYRTGKHVFLPEIVPAVRTVVPQLTAVHTSGVLVVPPSPSYSYEYSYSAPDGKHPSGDNKTYVAVRVNS